MLDFTPDVLIPVAGGNLELLLEQFNNRPIGQGRTVGMTAALTQICNLLQKAFPVHSAPYLAVRVEHYTRVREMQPGQTA